MQGRIAHISTDHQMTADDAENPHEIRHFRTYQIRASILYWSQLIGIVCWCVPIWYPSEPIFAGNAGRDGHPEAHRSKDGKPRYRVRIAVTDPTTGKRRNVTGGTYRTRKEAEAAEREAIQRRERGTLLDPSTATVGSCSMNGSPAWRARDRTDLARTTRSPAGCT